MEQTKVADGLFRLMKWNEDHNPVFPSRETVVEVKGEYVINVSTGRRCRLDALNGERSLFGPLANAYDLSPIEALPEIKLGPPHSEGDSAMEAAVNATPASK